MLAGSLCLLPFIVPYHQAPIWSFQSEWLALTLGVAASLCLLSQPRSNRTRPSGLVWLLLFALLVAVRAAGSSLAYPQQGILGGLYVLFAALMVWLGAQLRDRLDAEAVVRTLATCLIAGALLNALAGVIQFHGRPTWLEDFVTELRSRRVYGNIAQANLYSNYLALGAISVIYLASRRALRPAFAYACVIVLAYAAELAGSRIAMVYALWPALLALALPLNTPETRQLRRTALICAVLMAGTLALASGFNTLFWTGESVESGVARLLQTQPPGPDPRIGIWKVAVTIFLGAPWFGVGIGEFPGAAFRSGLDPSFNAQGSIWTSPHNLALHLLAETGITGFLLIAAFAGTWFLGALRTHRLRPSTVTWWAIACIGVQFGHSMLEFPLWFAHFLGLTALLMGALSAPGQRRSTSPMGMNGGMIMISLILASALLLTLRDYVRLDSTRITGTTLTLASAQQATEDAATMAALGESLLAPTADYWKVQKAQIDRHDLKAKLASSGRAIRLFPGPSIVTRHAIFLAFDGKAEESRNLLLLALRSFPRHCHFISRLLEEASGVDENAIAPLKSASRSHRCAAESQL